MKNNQFKKVIRQEIEKECKTFDFQSVYVDKTKNHRMIYIYTLEWVYAGMFSCYFMDDSVHLEFTNLTTLPLILHKVREVNAKYTEFEKIISEIKIAFDIMDRTEG